MSPINAPSPGSSVEALCVLFAWCYLLAAVVVTTPQIFEAFGVVIWCSFPALFLKAPHALRHSYSGRKRISAPDREPDPRVPCLPFAFSHVACHQNQAALKGVSFLANLLWLLIIFTVFQYLLLCGSFWLSVFPAGGWRALRSGLPRYQRTIFSSLFCCWRRFHQRSHLLLRCCRRLALFDLAPRRHCGRTSFGHSPTSCIIFSQSLNNSLFDRTGGGHKAVGTGRRRSVEKPNPEELRRNDYWRATCTAK